MIEKFIGVGKSRRLHRFIRKSKVTFFCLILTIIVLRGTIGAGKFGTPEQDFLEIRNRFASRKFTLHRANHIISHTNSSFIKDLFDNNDDFVSSKSPSLLETMIIKNWDENRQNWLINHGIGVGGEVEKPRVVLVTGSSPRPCENSLVDYFLLKSIKNKVDYCRLHGLRVYYNMALLDAELSGFSAKLHVIRSLLIGHPEVEFVWWMDSDALFTNMAFEVPWGRYKPYNLVIHGLESKVYEERNLVGWYTGSFLIRNCQWSLDLIEEWSRMGPSGKVRVDAGEVVSNELKMRPMFKADDQSAMVYLLLKEKEKWAGKVYLENEYSLHGFWEILVDRFEEMLEKYEPGFGDQRWPLVTHFVGCNLCAKMGDYHVERCWKQMERALNFGDDQILHMYGFAHTSLSSTRVKRVQNHPSNH